MRDGDISNEIAPRVLVRFEGLIVLRPEPPALHLRIGGRRGRRLRRAVEAWATNERAFDVLWDATRRLDVGIDVFTLWPVEMTEHVRARLDTDNIPYSHLHHYDDAGILSRRLAHLPWVVSVVHAEEENVFSYGPRGRLVDPQTFTIL